MKHLPTIIAVLAIVIPIVCAFVLGNQNTKEFLLYLTGIISFSLGGSYLIIKFITDGIYWD